MKFRWLITVLLIATGCTSQAQTRDATQSLSVVSPMHSASAPTTSTPVAQNNLPTIISVGDGDTARVKRSNRTITIRFACIDAPETAQTPWGPQASNRLKQLLPPGQAVQVREVDVDQYGRTVGELFLGNQSVNLTMVREGQAVVYREYLDNCADTRQEYLDAEAQAKAQKLGFWNQPNPVMPWDFRRGKRSNNQQSSNASPSPRPQSTAAASEAVLTANDPNSQINLRATPSTTGKRQGYGLVGDGVQVIDQTTSEGYTWYKVRFPRSGAQGWIRQDFISVGRTAQQPSPSTPTEPSTSQQAQSNNCDPSYPDNCIPPAPPDLDCKDISYKNFRVLPPDPHGFDGRDNDGLGCES